MQIRESRATEAESIRQVHLAAFGEPEGATVSALALELLEDPSAMPQLSLVAEERGQLLGHILFTPVALDDDWACGGYILAPLAVAPASHGKGVGSALIEQGLAMLRERGIQFVLVLGDPNYYTRSGFQAGHNLAPPHELPYPEAWMAQALQPGALAHLAGVVQCADALNAPEHW